MKKEFEFRGGRTLTVDTEEHRMDVYFGKPTESPEESTQLAEWIFESFGEGVKDHMEEQFCVVADMSDLDDSTLPSEGAKAIYTKHILANRVVDHFVFITRSHGMKMLLGVLVTLSGRGGRITVVDSKEAGEKAFQKWKADKSAEAAA